MPRGAPTAIVALDGHTLNPGDNPWDQVSALGDLQVYTRSTPTEILERARNAEILITNKASLTAEILNHLPNLRFITVTATGVNVVDLESAARRGIPVSNVPEYASKTVAQFVLAQMLTLSHQIPQHDAAIREGAWTHCGDFSFWNSPQLELAGKTMGIIGLGRIGKEVARLASCLGMHIMSVTGRRSPPSTSGEVEYVSLPSLLQRADFISLHCPLNDSNIKLVDSAFLSAMKSSAFLINTARGGLVDESSLAAALKDRTIAGAALDVVSTEPITPDNPLLSAPNCLLTPHMAWASLESRRRLMNATATNIEAFGANKPVNVVN